MNAAMKIAFAVLAGILMAEIIIMDAYPPCTIRQFKSHIIILAVLLTLFITAYGIMIWTK